MATRQDAFPSDTVSSMEDLWDELSLVPSVFTLNLPGIISVTRMHVLKKSIDHEVESLQHLPKKYEEDTEEIIQSLDLLTWLEFKIGSFPRALELNDRALVLSEEKRSFTWGNRAHLMCFQRDFEEAKSCMHKLDQLKERESHDKRIAGEKASQAYCHFRLGGNKNTSIAITLFEEALETYPQSYLWTQQLGICYNRLPYMASKIADVYLKTNRLDKAERNFLCVANKSSNPRLRAFAFSDLAKINKNAHEKVTLCEAALELANDDPYVVLNCATSLMQFDLDKAISLLERESNPTSKHLTQLGKCYTSKAKQHKKDKDLLAKYSSLAEECYRRGVDENPLSMQCRHFLAMHMLKHSKLEETWQEFRKILADFTRLPKSDYAFYLMKAYEYAGICQLKLCKDARFTGNLSAPTTATTLRKEAEVMLIKALEIALNICSPRDVNNHLGVSLNCLSSFADETEKQLYSWLNALANRPGSIDEALIEVKRYLSLEAFEKAYALLMFIARSLPIDANLRRQVMLSAAWDRLLKVSADADRILKSYFDHHERKMPSGYSSQLSEIVDSGEDEELLDVLILYDDSCKEATGGSHLSTFCSRLQQALVTIFGLNTSQNMQTSCAAVPVANLQLKVAAKAKLVLVVVGSEPTSKYFQSLLEKLLGLVKQNDGNGTGPRLMVALIEEGVTVPTSILQDVPRTPPLKPLLGSLDTYLQRYVQDRPEAPAGDSGRVAEDDLKRCVGDIMSFYCCLISTSWPLPTKDDTA
ncbi:hypothetical protein EGW08_022689 [Elysia chlorotica]|uniref:Uncharacterized protein n=1 Tax=Elysia chlorotica TaxID=188477 RepID=A0A3S0Z521_ELYCH|nr:hypothetical protein EGW08_022689 [Elysia chlorotica]